MVLNFEAQRVRNKNFQTNPDLVDQTLKNYVSHLHFGATLKMILFWTQMVPKEDQNERIDQSTRLFLWLCNIFFVKSVQLRGSQRRFYLLKNRGLAQGLHHFRSNLKKCHFNLNIFHFKLKIFHINLKVCSSF